MIGQPLNPPYSLVCAARHVLADELADEPELEANGTLRCSESGCLGLVFSHCEQCRRPIPGHIDGARYERHGNVSVPRGKLGTARGLLPSRQWREDCPYCKSPFPWASREVWVNYHRQHLADVAHRRPESLPHLPQAEAAYDAARGDARARKKGERRRQRRAQRARLATGMLDTWPRRVTAVVAAIVAVLALLFGVTSIADLSGGDRPSATTTTTTGP